MAGRVKDSKSDQGPSSVPEVTENEVAETNHEVIDNVSAEESKPENPQLAQEDNSKSNLDEGYESPDESGSCSAPTQEQAQETDKESNEHSDAGSCPGPNDEKAEGASDTQKKPKLLPNDHNGSDLLRYTWGQSLDEIDIRVSLPENIRVKGKQVIVEVTKKHIKVGLQNLKTLIVDGEMFGEVLPGLCFWNVEDGQTIFINLEKANKMIWWPHLILTDPLIDTSRVDPGSDLEALDENTRGIVRRMLYDRRQRLRELPTSHEQQAEMAEQWKHDQPDTNLDDLQISSN